MPPRDVVMLPHAVSCWAIPPCCVKDDGGRTPPISHIIRRVHPFNKRCGGVGSRHRALKGVTCVVFVWFHQPSSPLIVWGAVVEPAAESAHESFQPDPGHVKNDGQVGAGLDAAPPTPTPSLQPLGVRMSLSNLILVM